MSRIQRAVSSLFIVSLLALTVACGGEEQQAQPAELTVTVQGLDDGYGNVATTVTGGETATIESIDPGTYTMGAPSGSIQAI